MIVVGLLILVIATISVVRFALYNSDYQRALDLVESGDYEEARVLFEKVGYYKDAKDHLKRFYTFPTVIRYNLLEKQGSAEFFLNEYNLPAKIVTNNTIQNNVCEFFYSDETGFFTKQQVTYEVDGTESYEYTYHDNDEHAEILYTALDGRQALQVFTYDKKDRLIDERYTAVDGRKYAAVKTYDKDGNLIVDQIDTLDGIRYTYEYIYDENGNMLSEVCTDSDGNRSATEYTYDAEEYLIRVVYTDIDGAVYTTEYTYDANGAMSGYVETVPDGTQYVAEYSYDAAGNCIREVVTEPDGRQFVGNYTYDIYGNSLRREWTNPDGTQEWTEKEFELVYVPFDIPRNLMNMLTSVWGSY